MVPLDTLLSITSMTVSSSLGLLLAVSWGGGGERGGEGGGEGGGDGGVRVALVLMGVVLLCSVFMCFCALKHEGDLSLPKKSRKYFAKKTRIIC